MEEDKVRLDVLRAVLKSAQGDFGEAVQFSDSEDESLSGTEAASLERDSEEDDEEFFALGISDGQGFQEESDSESSIIHDDESFSFGAATRAQAEAANCNSSKRDGVNGSNALPDVPNPRSCLLDKGGSGVSREEPDLAALVDLGKYRDVLHRVQLVDLRFVRTCELPSVLSSIRSITREMPRLEHFRMDVLECDAFWGLLPYDPNLVQVLTDVLKNIKSARKLNLGSLFLSLQALHVISCMSALVELHLDTLLLESKDSPDTELSLLSKLQSLKELRLTLEVLDHRHPGVETAAPVLAPGARTVSLDFAGRMTNLVSLSVHFENGSGSLLSQKWSLGPLSTVCVTALGALSALEELEFRNSGDVAIARGGQAIGSLAQLRSLNLHACQLGEDGAVALSLEIPRLSNLTSLDLGVNLIGTSGSQHLMASISKLTSLTHLDLTASEVGKDIPGVVKVLHSNQRLLVLRLERTGLEDGGATELAAALHETRHMREIDLSWNSLGSDGVAAIFLALLDLVSLQAVDLGFDVKPDMFDWDDGHGGRLIPDGELQAGWLATVHYARAQRDAARVSAERSGLSLLSGMLDLRKEAERAAQSRSEAKEMGLNTQGVHDLFKTMQDEVSRGGECSDLDKVSVAVAAGSKAAKTARDIVWERQAAVRKARSRTQDLSAVVTARNIARERQLEELSALLTNFNAAVLRRSGAVGSDRSDEEVAADLQAALESERLLTQRLASDLGAAESCIRVYWSLVNDPDPDSRMGEMEPMGSLAEPLPPDSSVADVLAAFEGWSRSCDFEPLATASNTAMSALIHAAVELPSLLEGWDRHCAATTTSRTTTLTLEQQAAAKTLESAISSAGSAIDAERKAQLGDRLAHAPCRELVRAAQHLLAEKQERLEHMRASLATFVDVQTEQRKVKTVVESGVTLAGEIGSLQARVETAVSAAEETRDELEAAERRLQRKRMRGDALNAMEEEERREKRAAWEAARESVQGAAKRMMELEQDFPEAARCLSRLVPPELLPLWDPSRSLSSFEAHELLSPETPHHHAVLRVRDQGQWFAVKEFAFDHAGLLGALHEASVLHRLRHPALSELVRVFVDHSQLRTKVYLQTPLYAHGPLDMWIKSRGPTWMTVRRALLEVIGALEHLHCNGIVHAKVKPANILVGAGERARLVDLDAVKRNAESIVDDSALHCLDEVSSFSAPEVEMLGVTAAADVFSFGKTLAVPEIRLACSVINADLAGHPHAHDDSRMEVETEDDAVEELIGLLTLEDRDERLSAAQARQHRFFHPVVVTTAETEGGAATAECCVLASERCVQGLRIPLQQGVQCAEGHFCCAACLRKHVETAAGDDVRGRREHEGRVMCPKYPRECSAGPLPDTALAGLLAAQTMEAYLRSRVQLAEAKAVQELEEQNKVAVEREVERRIGEAAGAAARRHVEEEILQMKCPQCGQAFVDFDGCCALTCTRCGGGFCAWCLADCGADAHNHVAECAMKPAEADRFFGTMEQVDAVHRQTRQRKLEQYLDTLSAAVRRMALEQLSQTLKERLPGFDTGL